MYFCLPRASPVSVDTWVQVKGKVRFRTGQEGPDGGAWSTKHPNSFTLGMTRYPLYRRLGGPQGWCGKSHPPAGFDPQTVQSSKSLHPLCYSIPRLSSPASRYTHYAIRSPDCPVQQVATPTMLSQPMWVLSYRNKFTLTLYLSYTCDTQCMHLLI
jgi:hypothetical protein